MRRVAGPSGRRAQEGWRRDDLRLSVVDVGEEARLPKHQSGKQTLTERQATAFVSIMQGCDMHCTYCIVPRTRGAAEREPSGSPKIVAEVRFAGTSGGVKEVTLLGANRESLRAS